MTDHSDRVAIVTGSSKGIGLAVARELLDCGARVIVHGSGTSSVETAVTDLDASDRVRGVAGPIDDPHTAEQLVQVALTEFGGIDYLVTSAGVQRYGDAPGTPIDMWNEVMGVNVGGAFFAAHHSLPHIRARRGAMVLVSSVQATATQNQVVAYTASKGALNAMTRALAVDEAAHGVRVNSVSPGSIDTPMLRAAAAGFSDGTSSGIEATVREWGRSHPLGRVGTPGEVARVVSFLLGPESSFVTGAEVRVDGGLLAQLGAALPTETER